MKKLLKENLKIFIAIIITSIVATTTTIFAYSLIANDVGFTPKDTTWEVDNTKDAIDDLHENLTIDNSTIFVASSWKGAKSWLDSGFSNVLIKNEKYISVSNEVATITKDCKIKITGFMRNTTAPTSAPQYKLYYNNKAILSFSNSVSSETYIKKEIELSVKKNDTIYVSMYGGGNPTYYITWFDIIK